MFNRWVHQVMLGAVAALVSSGCAARTPDLSALPPARAPLEPAASDTTPTGRAADVRFMQHMLHHHAQAVLMTGMVAERTPRDDLRRMAQRIDASQRDEMAYMRRWLAARGVQPESAAGMEHGGHAGHDATPSAAMTSMPGMLGPAELERLRAARGPTFDRLFLEGMIRHHEGAVAMVAALLGTRGAAQDAELFRFASDVDGDQRAEIARMRQLLAAFGA